MQNGCVAITGRSKKGKFVRVLDTAERDAEAARLRGRGHGYAEIAVIMGYADASGAWRAVARALTAAAGEGTAMAKRLELDRIDRLLVKVQEIMDRPGPAVDRMGKPLVDEETGERLPNRDIQLAAIDRATRLLERRAKLLGTDAPKRSIHMTLSAFLDSLPPGQAQAELAAMRAELGLPLDEDDTLRVAAIPAIAGTVVNSSHSA